jgi:hypothetical protein
MSQSRPLVSFVLALGLATLVWSGASGGTQQDQGTADSNGDGIPDTIPAGGALTGEWKEIPGSSMNSVFVKGTDDVFKTAPNSWDRIQSAWSGGTCVGDELFTWGGGHGDGAHNGLLAVNVSTGKWRRVTEPSPIWTDETCPGGVCPAKTGDCQLGRCNTGPDGRPVARHSYYLLTSDGSNIYTVGGGTWPGGGADPPRGWKFDLRANKWSPLASESAVTKPHGSLVYVQGKLYQMTAGGFGIMDVATGKWTRPKGVSGVGGMTGLVYVPTVDRFYALGNGVAWYVDRAIFGTSAKPVSGAPSILENRYLGMTYFPPADLILIWNGGSRVTTLDPHTNTWGEIQAQGDPGPSLEKGTFGRFSYCGGRVVLVNGVSSDVFYLNLTGSTPDPLPPPTPPVPDPSPEPPANPPPDTVPPGDTPPPDATVTPAPYYSEPPGDKLVLDQCGPESDWQVTDVTTDADVENLRKIISSDTRVVIRVHWRPQPYPELRVKNGRCVKVVGIAGPDGERPLVGGVNGTHGFKGEVRPGGLIVENLDVSPGKVKQLAPSLNTSSGPCLGVPNDQMFFIVRDSDVTECPHHAFITGHAHQLYVEVGRSHFAQAGSHLAYIDHIAMAYIYDSTFESPGWGHALRCVALRCRIERTAVSNVQLDGSVLPVGGSNPFQPDQTYIGMQPLEVYTCGENEVRDVRAVFLADDNHNGRFAATVRGRDDLRTCDVGEVKDGQWTRLKWGDPDYVSAKRWKTVTPLPTTVERMLVTCVGPTPCYGWDVKGSYPVMDNPQGKELQLWLKTNKFAAWDDMLKAIPDERPEWRWIASVTLPRHRHAFLAGTITSKVPLPVGASWFQRTNVVFKTIKVQGGEVLRPLSSPNAYCYGIPPNSDANGDLLDQCSQQDDGAHYRRGYVEFR